MPRSIGSGGAFFDFDGDGLLDIYLLQNDGPNSPHKNQLYRQTESGFVNVSADSGLDVAGYGMGVACGDVNNDGRVDVVLNEYGRARLLLNQTEGAEPRFVDISDSAGISNLSWGTSASFWDYDRDGWLDLLLVNYVNYDPSRWCADSSSRQEFCGPDNFPGRVDKLFHNRGAAATPADVRFDDVTEASGFGAKPGPGFAAYCADFDGDHWPDVFISNDGATNHLWMNQRDGTFREEAGSRGLGYNSMGKAEANMGITIGDADGDGLFDVFVTHLAVETHTLWSQKPRGVFIDQTALSGLTKTKWRGTGFGTLMQDIDNDGDLDILLANGRVIRERGPQPEVSPALDGFWHPYAQRDQILLNEGTGRFADASPSQTALCGLASVSRGMLAGDFNNDGRLDILVTNIAERPRLLQNVCGTDKHWLTVRAFDPRWNRDAYGAEVYLQVNEQTLMRWINPSYSYLNSNDPRAHFGLNETAKFQSIRIVWPDGVEEEFPGGKADSLVTCVRGAGKLVE
ncbi:MAG: CRTAC1 family protein [Planctomycetales bacterium]|nr:CRTAC1 family protein [Planctomycetales bacterium]